MLKNLLLLSVCQALMLSSTSLTMASSALVGLRIAPQMEYATLPLGICYMSVMLALIPMSLFMQRYGRKKGFFLGAASGLCGGLLAGLGIYTGNFILFCLSAACQGIAMSSAQFYRFAAAELAEQEYRSRAISWVLAGGLVSAFLGPSIALFSRDSFGMPEFSVSFSMISLLCAGILACLPFLSLPASELESHDLPVRPLHHIFRLPAFLLAVFCAMVAYGIMNLLMVSTPLSMNARGIDFSYTSTVIQWHIVGMFAPSFFTGHLIHRFGVLKVMMAGALTLFACILTSTLGSSFTHYMIGLVCLGIGWNFLFIGGTTLLTEVYRPSEKGIVQGINDFLVFACVSFTAMVSGYVHYHFGWETLNLVTIPALVLASIGVAALYAHTRNRVIAA